MLFTSLALLSVVEVYAQEIWEPASGAPVGVVAASTAAQNGDIFVTMDNGRIYKSSDNGTTWEISRSDEWRESNAVLVNNLGHLFAQYELGGFERSIDNGISWQNFSIGQLPGLALDSMQRIIIPTNLGADTSHGYFYLTVGISVSTDEGVSWMFRNIYDGGERETFNYGLPQISVFSAGSRDTLYLGSSDTSIFIATDSSVTKINGSLHANCLLKLPGGPLLVGSSHGIWTLDDSNWTELSGGLPDTAVIQLTCDRQGTLYALTALGLFRSLDQALSWNQIDNPLDAPAISLGTAVSDSRVFAGTDRAFYSSSDQGEHWSKISHGIGGLGINAFASTTNGIFVWTSNGWFNSSDEGDAWGFDQALDSIGVSEFEYVFKDDTLLFISDVQGLLKSTDNGLTWTAANNGLPPKDTSGYYDYYYLTLDSCGRLYCDAFDTEWSFFVSTDFGNSWHQPRSGTPYYLFSSIVSSANCSVFAAGGNGVFQSFDNGQSWSQSNSGLTDTNVQYLAIDSKDNLYAFSGVNHSLFFSSDRGNSWQYRWSFDSLSDINEVMIDRYDRIFVVAQQSPNPYWLNPILYVSADEGISWTLDSCLCITNNGIEPCWISNIFETSDHLYATTEIGLASSEFQSNDVTESPFSSCSLKTFPNPFSQSTTITFTSDSSGYAEVSIVNSLGADVAHLYSGELAAGEHSFTWSDPNICNGMYECLVRINGETKSLPMVLAR